MRGMRRTSIIILLAAGLAIPGAGASASDPVPLVDGTPVCGEATPAPGAPTPVDDGVLKVATYNVLHSLEVDADKTLGARLELAADALHAAGTDVVGAQEVVKNPPADTQGEFPQKHGRVAERLAQELADRSGDTWSWCWSQSNPHFPGEPDLQPGGGGGPLSEAIVEGGRTVLRGEFREGLAILSRFPIAAARFRRLPPRSYEAPFCVPPDPFNCNLAGFFDSRQLLWARIDGPGGAFDMFTTHIAHGLTPLSDTTKLAQVKAALAYIQEWSDPATPDFFVGDLNSAPSTDRHAAVLEAGFGDTYADSGGPVCGSAGTAGCTSDQQMLTPTSASTVTSRIDYVFERGCTTTASLVFGTNAQFQTTGEFAGQWLWPSDHLGVVSSVTCP